MDVIAQARAHERAVRVVRAEFVAEGQTNRLYYEGRHGFGVRIGVHASGTIRGLPGWHFSLDEHTLIRVLPWQFENWGVTTVQTPLGEFLLPFYGKVRGLPLVAVGECSVEGRSGALAGWRGMGTYAGPAGFRFQVTFAIEWPADLTEHLMLT